MSAGLFTRYQFLDIDYLEDGILLAVDYTMEGPWSASTQDSDLIARGGGSAFSIAALYETA